MRSLAVFDIDGTLTDTNAVDDECYLRAVADVLGVDLVHVEWSDAPHVTDSALLQWLAERNGLARISAEQEAQIIGRFLELLEAALMSSPARFQPIAGAPTVCELLASHSWDVAFATGGWEPSARLKLNAIGIDPSAFALASSSDAATRTAIVSLAIRRAQERATSFARIVSVGDGVWDVRTAAALEVPFVGIASGERATRLRLAGAATILPDLEDTVRVCAALETASVPPRR
jgi:phosphoglycolate phosphatase-like HAD superfamily hydrolase